MTTFPRNILTTRAISSLISLPILLSGHNPQHDDIPVLISLSSYTFPESAAFFHEHLWKQKRIQQCLWVRLLVRLLVRLGTADTGQTQGPALSAAASKLHDLGPGLNTSELQFIICKLNSSLPHILRILHTIKGSQGLQGVNTWNAQSLVLMQC